MHLPIIQKNFNPRTSRGDKGEGGGGGGDEAQWIPQGFPILKWKLSSNQNETSSTCSPITNTAFDVNWMTSSIIINAHLIM